MEEAKREFLSKQGVSHFVLSLLSVQTEVQRRPGIRPQCKCNFFFTAHQGKHQGLCSLRDTEFNQSPKFSLLFFFYFPLLFVVFFFSHGALTLIKQERTTRFYQPERLHCESQEVTLRYVFRPEKFAVIAAFFLRVVQPTVCKESSRTLTKGKSLGTKKRLEESISDFAKTASQCDDLPSILSWSNSCCWHMDREVTKKKITFCWPFSSSNQFQSLQT